MNLQTYSHTTHSGWSIKPDAGLDSANTLVIALGARTIDRSSDPLRQLAAIFPRISCVGRLVLADHCDLHNQTMTLTVIGEN